MTTADIVIVNWNAGEALTAAAASAMAFGGTPIVVDNASSDGSIERLERNLPEVHVIRNTHNAGFARACNIGAAAGSGELIVLLNPDAEIVKGSVADLEAAFEYHAGVAIVGPAIEGTDGSLRPSVRRFPTTASLCLYQLKLHPLARWIPSLRSYFMLDFRGTTPALVDQVMGAALVMKRADWARFGGMDESYFLWFEEVDLCKRVFDAGRSTLYWPNVVVRHIGAASFKQLPAGERQRHWNRSAARYADRHLPKPGAALVRATMPASRALNWLSAFLRRRTVAARRPPDPNPPPL